MEKMKNVVTSPRSGIASLWDDPEPSRFGFMINEKNEKSDGRTAAAESIDCNEMTLADISNLRNYLLLIPDVSRFRPAN